MKASDIINKLQTLIKENGDREVEVNGEFWGTKNIEYDSRLSVTRIGIFEDSDNIQIFVDEEI